MNLLSAFLLLLNWLFYHSVIATLFDHLLFLVYLDVSPAIRIRRRIRNRSFSVSEQEELVSVNSTNNKRNQRRSSLHSPEITATYCAPVDAVNLVTSTDVPSTQALAPAPSSSIKEQSRGLFSRISLKHKRRSFVAQGHRASLGRVFNH